MFAKFKSIREEWMGEVLGPSSIPGLTRIRRTLDGALFEVWTTSLEYNP
jgi:hypothetical protein